MFMNKINIFYKKKLIEEKLISPRKNKIIFFVIALIPNKVYITL